MRVWLRFAVSFFVLCVVIAAFAFFFGPTSFRQNLRDNQSPVGQLPESHQLNTPGQQPGATSAGTESATTEPVPASASAPAETAGSVK